VGALIEVFPADGDPTELGGRAIAYLVLAGVPLALAVKTFRAFLPVLTLLFRASLALGGVVALTAIYDAYMVSRTGAPRPPPAPGGGAPTHVPSPHPTPPLEASAHYATVMIHTAW
jgi:hypothetical protein